MPRAHTAWQTRFSKAEKEACIRAAIVDRLSYAEVARRAKAGELPGCGRVDIAANYIGKLTREARASFQPERLADPTEAGLQIDLARARALAWILRALDQWEKKARTGDTDLLQHGRLMRALAEHEKATKGKHEPGTSDDAPGQNTGPTAMETIAALLAAAQNGNSNGHNETTPEPASSAQGSDTRSGAPSA